MKHVTNARDLGRYYDRFWSDEHLDDQAVFDLREYEIEALDYAYASLRRHFGTLEGTRVLEVGPGKGYNVLRFAREGAAVVAVDVSTRSLHVSQRLLEQEGVRARVQFLEMDAHELQFGDGEFDIVFVSTTMMHLDQGVAINEFERVLKTNGVLVLVEPTTDNCIVNAQRALFSKFKDVEPVYMNCESMHALSGVFRRSQTKGFYLISFVALPLRRWRLLYRSSVAVLKSLETFVLSAFPYLERFTYLKVSLSIK